MTQILSLIDIRNDYLWKVQTLDSLTPIYDEETVRAASRHGFGAMQSGAGTIASTAKPNARSQ
jgi:hypothetical protein